MTFPPSHFTLEVTLFSTSTRRSGSDVCDLLSIDFSDVTLVSEDTCGDDEDGEDDNNDKNYEDEIIKNLMMIKVI